MVVNKEVIVFYGTRDAADSWAREQGINPRTVILATNPDALRGRSGYVRTVRDATWNPGVRGLELAEQTTRYIQIVEATLPRKDS